MILVGCTDYGVVKKNEVDVKFPIRVDTNKIQADYEFDYNPNHPYFHLKIKNIAKVKIGYLTLEGLFDITLDFQPGTGEQINEKEYDFYYVYITITNGDINDYLKLISAEYFFSSLTNPFNEEVLHFIDTKNEVWYTFNFRDNVILIWKENWKIKDH